MNIGELNAPPRKKRKRVGRGPGSGHGKTSGRGHKGQKARSGWKERAWFEGGQMPLQRRVPKRGFKSLNKKVFQLVNINALKKFEDGETADPVTMKQKGLVRHANRPIKILGVGEIDRKLVVHADAFSQSAQEKISQAGGETHIRTIEKKQSNDSVGETA